MEEVTCDDDQWDQVLEVAWWMCVTMWGWNAMLRNAAADDCAMVKFGSADRSMGNHLYQIGYIPYDKLIIIPER